MTRPSSATTPGKIAIGKPGRIVTTAHQPTGTRDRACSPRKHNEDCCWSAEIASLTLAADYAKQEYLATMEGAVVSGRRAAALVQEWTSPDRDLRAPL
jgi:uncharacterized protein with NAD-binding domain and iron-sulfur cluster